MFRSFGIGLLLLPLALVSGCAWFASEDVLKPAELVDFEPTVKLEKIWSTGVGAGQDNRYTRFVPAFSDGLVFVADHKGRVFALDQETGKKVWQRKTGLATSGAVGAGAGMVLLGTYSGEVVALQQEDGEELWRAKASTEVLAPPQTNGDVVVAQTIDGRVFAYDAATGARRWSYDHPVPTLTLRTTARPLLTDSQLFVGFDNGQLVSFNPENGVIRWDVRVGQPQGGSDLDRIVDVDASPLLADPLVYGAAYQGSVVAVSRGTGRLVWKQDVSTFHDMAHGNGKLYVVMDDSRVVAYVGSTGAVAWENEQMLRRGLGAPAAFGDYLAVIDDQDYMHVLSQEDGSFAQRLKPPGNGFRSPLKSVDDVLYVLSDNGKLTAYRVASEK
jgi:outer membrane protein assembly factor BamB